MEDVGTVKDKRVVVRTLDPLKRSTSFDEVALGYTEEEALREASRCLHCNNPRCVKGCPVKIEIPKFIEAICHHDFDEAYQIIRTFSSLPAVCGRVCPQESQCEKMCIKGLRGDAIAIGSLERFVSDYAFSHAIAPLLPKERKKESIAIVGSGPSGLSCAGVLASQGYSVTIYEAFHQAGGVLTYGIPAFRLPKEIVKQEIKNLEHLGVQLIYDTVIGSTLTIEDLKKEYDAIYIASGAGLPKFMGIPHETANGVFSANEILTRINLMGMGTPLYSGNDSFVIGGGNVACDVARSLKRKGKNVTLLYRRGINDMPARKEEVKHLQEEGILIREYINPISIVVDEENNCVGVDCIHMQAVGEENGRTKVEEKKGSEERLPCDMVVLALGTTPNPLAMKHSTIAQNEKGCIEVVHTKTSDEQCYAGGDVVTGSATVILAMEAGKKAAYEIIEDFEKRKK